MTLLDAQKRFENAVRILVQEPDRISDRLLIAYVSQLSLIDAKADLPEGVYGDFLALRNAISDAEMPYGDGERAATKIKAMTEREASKLAGDILSMFLKLDSLASTRIPANAR